MEALAPFATPLGRYQTEDSPPRGRAPGFQAALVHPAEGDGARINFPRGTSAGCRHPCGRVRLWHARCIVRKVMAAIRKGSSVRLIRSYQHWALLFVVILMAVETPAMAQNRAASSDGVVENSAKVRHFLVARRTRCSQSTGNVIRRCRTEGFMVQSRSRSLRTLDLSSHCLSLP